MTIEISRELKKPFVVQFWRNTFEKRLKWLSIFQYLAFGRGESSWIKSSAYDRSVELWATGHLVGSFVICFLGILLKQTVLIYLIYLSMAYGTFRIVEVLISIVRTLMLFNPISRNATGQILQGAKPTVKGYRRSLILVVYNYGEIVFWFAIPYGVFNWLFVTTPVDTAPYSWLYLRALQL